MAESPSQVEELKKWHKGVVAEFADLRKELTPASEQLEAVLRAVAAEIAPDAKVYVRVKGELSTSEKFLRDDNYTRHPKPLDCEKGLTDLIGGQIVAYTRRDVDALCTRIEQLGAAHRDPGAYRDKMNGDGSLEVDESNSVDTATRLAPTEFGYTARHYIVRFHGNRLLGVDIAKASEVGRKMEVQICHVMTHAWTVVTHDRVYKTDLTTPLELKRRVAEAKAMLDTSARQVEEAVVELDRYRRKHAGRLAASAARNSNAEINEFLKAKLTCDSVISLAPEDNPTTAHLDAMQNRSELAIAERDWSTANALLNRIVQCRPQLKVRLAEVQRHVKDKGAAILILEAALNDNPADGEAACAMADLIFSKEKSTEKDFRDVEDKLAPAFKANPGEPNLLKQYITARLLRDRDATQLIMLRGALIAAIAECRKRCDLGSDVPACLLQHARLALFADDVFDAVNTYCLASLHGAALDQLRDEQRLMSLLLERINVDAKVPGVQSLRVALECTSELLNLLIAHKDVSSSPTSNPNAIPHLAEGPIVILAGGCDKKDEAHLARYDETIESAFRRFRGTIISGGTRSGISGLAARIAEETRDEATGEKTITAIGYLPPKDLVISHGDRIDKRYKHIVHVKPRETGDPLYSPLGPIQTWKDLLATGRDLKQIRVVGINGGKVSGFEFRLALAMGAVVGLIEDSGRAVATLLTDPHWKVQSGLARLLCDAETIELFVNVHAAPITDQAPLGDDTVKALGECFHAKYRDENKNKPEYVDDSMREWAKLDPIFKESNLQQVRAMQWILSTEGFAIVSIDDEREGIDLGMDDPERPGKRIANDAEAIKGRVEPLARLEHARWNAERFAAGWTQGPERSLAKKTNKWLVPYDALPRDMQVFDLDPYLNLAKLLIPHNLKIVDTKAPIKKSKPKTPPQEK